MLTAILKIVPCWELIDATSYKWIHLKTASPCYTGETLLNTYNRNTEYNLEIYCTTNSNGDFYTCFTLFFLQGNAVSLDQSKWLLFFLFPLFIGSHMFLAGRFFWHEESL